MEGSCIGIEARHSELAMALPLCQACTESFDLSSLQGCIDSLITMMLSGGCHRLSVRP
jgi:hypothetical protein